MTESTRSVKEWWFTLEFKKDAPVNERYALYEEALAAYPGSYKLWRRYLQDLHEHANGIEEEKRVERAYERALVYMNKMPVIWREYLAVLADHRQLTSTRRVFDRALRALPITQHDMLWPAFLEYMSDFAPTESAAVMWRRYVQLRPDKTEDFVDFLVGAGHYDEAAVVLARVVNDVGYSSARHRTKKELWDELLKLVVDHSVTALDVDALIRSGTRRFAHEIAALWNALAEYYTRRRQFERARDVYEEALRSVTTVRDFSLVFDAFSAFEEGLLSLKMEVAEKMAGSSQDAGATSGGDALVASLSSGDLEEQARRLLTLDLGRVEALDYQQSSEKDLDMRLARIEHLINQRPLLLNSVVLRQNPHNVAEWHKRARLMDTLEKKVLTLSEAVTTVDPAKAVGRPHSLWQALARLYIDNGDMDNARVIFDKAVAAPFLAVDHLASLYCYWAEAELLHGSVAMARRVLRQATAVPDNWRQISRACTRAEKDDGVSVHKTASSYTVQQRLYRSVRLWHFYADLEEAAAADRAGRVYEEMLRVRVATPQSILHFAALMWDQGLHDMAFRAYERGIALFSYPHVFPLWLSYIHKFLSLYKGRKVERARELFEQALEGAPKDMGVKLLITWAKFEERYGMIRRAMTIYKKASLFAQPSDRLSVFQIYVARCAFFFGPARCREVFDLAIKELPDAHVPIMCVQYADLERRLGEIQRARTAFTYGAQFCDPKTTAGEDYWARWYSFEVHHGDDETCRVMIRLKRTVGQEFSQSNVSVSSMVAPSLQQAPSASSTSEVTTVTQADGTGAMEVQIGGGERKQSAGDAMAALERRSAVLRASTEETQAAPPAPAQQDNAEEIDLDDDEDTDSDS